MPEITYRKALNDAFAEEILRDENVILMGEEVAEYNGAYKVTEGLWKRFGDRRVIDIEDCQAVPTEAIEERRRGDGDDGPSVRQHELHSFRRV